MYFVQIDGFETKDFGRTYFHINVSHDSAPHDPWIVLRRYSEFVALRNSLLNLHPEKCIPDLPPSTILAYFADHEFRAERAQGLCSFLRFVLREIEPDPRSTCLRDFLRIHRACPPKISLRESSAALLPKSGIFDWSEDVVQIVYSFLDGPEIVKLSRISRVWYFASLSPNLWHRLRIFSSRFERIQKGFLTLIDRLSCESPGVLNHFSLQVQFSSRETLNIRLSLPENTVFYNVKSLEFSSLYTPSNDMCSSEGLLVEILESIISNPETVCLTSVSITSNLNSEILRSLHSVCTFTSLSHLKLVFFRADFTSDTENLLISLMDKSASTLQELDIRVSYADPSVGAVPDHFGGERMSTLPGMDTFLKLLPRMTRLRKLHYDFFPKQFVDFDADLLSFPPGLEDLDIRFVVPSIGDGRDLSVADRRSLMLEVFRAVPKSIRRISLRTIGVDETEMMNYTEFIPYMFSSPQMTFDMLLPRLFAEWQEKFLRLESLELQGPQLVHAGFWRFLLQSDDNVDRFCSLFPRLEKFSIINSIYEFTESVVIRIIKKLGRLQTLELGGVNEKLTDNLLLSLADRSRDSEFFSRVWQSGFRSLTIPMTRYMSVIGLGAIQHALSKNKRVEITLDDPHRITGREKLVDEIEARDDKFIFTRF